MRVRRGKDLENALIKGDKRRTQNKSEEGQRRTNEERKKGRKYTEKRK